MNKRMGFTFLILLISLFSYSKTVNIGIVLDGNSPFLKKMLSDIKKETKSLVDKNVNLKFSDESIIYCNFDRGEISNAISMMNKNKNIDLCFVCGLMGSSIANSDNSLTKPFIVGPYLNFNESKLNNNVFCSTVDSDFLKDISTLLENLNFKRMVVIYPEIFGNLDFDFEKFVKESFNEKTDFRFIPSKLMDIDVDINEFSKDEAVLTVDKGYFNKTTVINVQNLLLNKGIPVFTTLSEEFIKKGAIAGYSTSNETLKIAKHMSILCINVIDGEGEITMPFSVNTKKTLFINSDSIEKTKCFFPYDILLDSVDVYEKKVDINSILDLKNVVQLSVENNLEIEIQKRERNMGKADVKKAKSILKPKLDVSLTEALLDKSAASSLLNVPENSITGEVSVTKVLFSEDANNYISIEKNILKAKEYQLDSKILDIMLSTCNAYINVLRAKSYLNIQKETLDLNRKNYKLAELRNEKGVTAPNDVYRWESIIAESQKSYLNGLLNLKNAKSELKRILNKDENFQLNIKDLTQNEALLFLNNQEILKMIENPHNLKCFSDFLNSKVNIDSPELNAYDSMIKASLREVTASKRNYWLPTVAVQGKYTDMFSKWGVGSSPLAVPPQFSALVPEIPDNYWSLGLSIKFSPFNGGAKSARKIKAFENFNKTKIEKENVKKQIETGLRVLVYKMRTSYDSINLTEKSLKAAEKNLKLVKDAYANGFIGITSLMDAQNAMTGAKELMKNSIYTFIADCLAIDRIATGFVSFKGKDEKNKLLSEILKFEKKYSEKEGK